MSQAAFHARAADVDEQKHNRLWEAQVKVGLDVPWGKVSDPYAPYLSSSVARGDDSLAVGPKSPYAAFLGIGLVSLPSLFCLTKLVQVQSLAPPLLSSPIGFNMTSSLR